MRIRFVVAFFSSLIASIASAGGSSYATTIEAMEKVDNDYYRLTVKVISANPYTKQAGRIKMSHLGRSGFRSSLDSTACMASLPRETPF